jgi:hypothetical protein
MAAAYVVLRLALTLRRGREFGMASALSELIRRLVRTSAVIALLFLVLWGLNYRRLPLEQTLRGASDEPWDFKDAQRLPGARTVWLDGGNDNRTRSHSIDLLGVLRQKPSLGATDRGALLVEVQNPASRYDDTTRRLIQITDLGLSGKLSPEGCSPY